MATNIFHTYTFNSSMHWEAEWGNLGQRVSVTWSSTNSNLEFPYDKFYVCVLNRDCCLLPVGRLPRSLLVSQPIQQIWHNYLQELTTTSLLSSRGSKCIVLYSENCPPMPSQHWCQSDAAPGCVSVGHGIHRVQPRGGEQHNRAQAVEECRPLSPCGGPRPIKRLRWHDSSTQKCP